MNDFLNLKNVQVHHDGDRWPLFDQNFTKYTLKLLKFKLSVDRNLQNAAKNSQSTLQSYHLSLSIMDVSS